MLAQEQSPLAHEHEYVNSTFRRHTGTSQQPPLAQSRSSPALGVQTSRASATGGGGALLSPSHPSRRPPSTPHGLRSPQSDQELSRVVEGEHETSRSIHSASSDVMRSRSQHSRHTSLMSPTAGSSSGRPFDNSDDWGESGLDRSMIIHIDHHRPAAEQQPPYSSYEDSGDSTRSRSRADGSRPSSSAAAQPQRGQFLSPRSRPGTGHGRSVDVASSHDGSVSSAAWSPRSANDGMPPVVQMSSRSPRSTRAAELRKENLLRQREDQQRREHKQARIEGRLTTPHSPTRATAASMAHPSSTSLPPQAKPKTAIELERERRRRAAAAGGMVQATRRSTDGGVPPASPAYRRPQPQAYEPDQHQWQHQQQHPRSPSHSARPPPTWSPLNSSTDRQVADAQALMANFRQLLIDLPDGADALQASQAPVAMPSLNHSYAPLELERQLSESDFSGPAAQPYRSPTTNWEDDLQELERDDSPARHGAEQHRATAAEMDAFWGAE